DLLAVAHARRDARGDGAPVDGERDRGALDRLAEGECRGGGDVGAGARARAAELLGACAAEHRPEDVLEASGAALATGGVAHPGAAPGAAAEHAAEQVLEAAHALGPPW